MGIVLSSLETFRHAHVHVAIVCSDIGGCGPFSGLGEGVALVFPGVPELDEGVFCWWIGRDVDERRTWY